MGHRKAIVRREGTFAYDLAADPDELAPEPTRWEALHGREGPASHRQEPGATRFVSLGVMPFAFATSRSTRAPSRSVRLPVAGSNA